MRANHIDKNAFLSYNVHKKRWEFMKKIFSKRVIATSVLIIAILFSIVFVTLNERSVEAQSLNYVNLDFTDKSKYDFDKTDSYSGEGWKIVKVDHDYTIYLNGVKASKIVMPMDDADKDCSLDNCGTKPRLSNIVLVVEGENIIYGSNKYEDGLIGNLVKNTTVRGSGSLTVNSTHGINIYSDVVFEDGLTVNVYSKVYGILSNHSLTIKGGKFKVVSGDASLISGDDMTIQKASIDAEILGDIGSTFTANKGIVESVEKLAIKDSDLNLRKGNSAIVAKEVSIENSTVKNDGKVGSLYGIWANGRDSGNLTIKNSTIDLKSTYQTFKSNGKITLDGGTYKLSSTERRTSVIEGRNEVLVTGKADLSVVGVGYGVSTTYDYGFVTFDDDTKIFINITGASVANIDSVDQFAISTKKTYLGKNIDFEAYGPNHVFRRAPTFTGGSFYIEASQFAGGDAKRYAVAKSKEDIMNFPSMFRYVKIVYKEDTEPPKISGYTEGKMYCSLPVLTVTDDTGIASVVVNGEKIRKFSTDTEYKKTFTVPILNSPIKEVVVTDVLGNVSKAKFTAYNGCAVDISQTRISFGGTFVYDGKEKKPVVSVYYGTRKLKDNADYKVTYSNNVYPGTATIKVTGIGGFEGTVTKYFTIEKADNVIKASNSSKVYATKAQTIAVNASQVGNAKLSYSSNNKSVTVNSDGKVTVKAKFIGKAIITIKANATSQYDAAVKTVTVTVNPPSIKISKLTNSKGKKMVVKWSKNTSVTGYQVQYSLDKNFKSGVKTVTLTKNSKTSTTISKLTKKKTYYVRIRTYKTVSGVKYYSSWSSYKKIKISK